MKKALPILFIAISASLWGIIAIFVRKLSFIGFSSMEIVTIRVVIATLLLTFIGIRKYRSQMAISVKDVKLFIGTGIFSIVLFNWCYFSSINQMNLSMAVILLYTAPAFVTVLSYFFLKEKMDWIKVVSVIGTILGCILITGVQVGDTSSINMIGIITGLGAGFGYALYTIFGKFALLKYPPFTVTYYTFIVASLALIPLTSLWEKGMMLFSSDVLIYGVGLGLVPTVIAYLFYTKGLEQLDGSKAAIVATVEPVVATLLGVFLYEEGFGIIQAFGSIIILISVTLINIPKKQKASIH
ncbi:DMT family transporter [Neobacillus thermocopriae]|uniref:EamA family transporter n=1 Tax=Neobacillus thermocopriae TaxID=1215031 RepID=A0A6B3TQZ9_9BACI|nr:EamA family transporter [Neobacillus thermocopriae]MED3625045.1 EamA family transporter [Neobacillus thermocopriae]MED3712757.1 EamA family transporter [Neobacillus thermocopriae]NEX78998.1 EamA family transporter [Neobacillus thermocopriae]